MTDESAKDAIILHLERELKAAQMTMRDQFAMAALDAALAKALHNFTVDCDYKMSIDWDHIVGSAYDAADTMMEARK